MDLGNYGKNKHVTFRQMLNQFLQKTLQIILGSRIPATLPYSWNWEVKKSDRWYHLAIGGHFAAMDDLCSWNRTLTEPMVIDIILIKTSENLSSNMSNKVVLERWTIRFESKKSTAASEICGGSCKKTYKKLIILLRSVYSILRLLPAYQAFCKLSSIRKNCGFDIKYNVSSFPGSFSELDESMKGYRFVPVEAEQGRFCVSVFYRQDFPDLNIDDFVLHPLVIISDYADAPCPSSRKSISMIQKDYRSFSKPLCSSRSPYSGSSRISRKSSFIDNFDDCDFSCPFIVDDTNPLDSQTSSNLDGTNSSEVSSKTPSTATTSQNVAILAVIRLLRKVPPLRRDPRCYSELEKKDGAASESEPFRLRKASDALEELKLYREMKDMIISKNAALVASKNTKSEA